MPFPSEDRGEQREFSVGVFGASVASGLEKSVDQRYFVFVRSIDEKSFSLQTAYSHWLVERARIKSCVRGIKRKN